MWQRLVERIGNELGDLRLFRCARTSFLFWLVPKFTTWLIPIPLLW
jgi:hypothetical protein